MPTAVIEIVKLLVKSKVLKAVAFQLSYWYAEHSHSFLPRTSLKMFGWGVWGGGRKKEK